MDEHCAPLAPLLKRDFDDLIAFIAGPNPLFAAPTSVRVDVFLGQVQALAERLPEAAHAVNLCDNRYCFMLAFCALIVRRQTNLLPPNKTVATQAALLSQYPDSYVIHDGCEVVAAAQGVNIADFTLPVDVRGQEMPLVDMNFVAAITFTSGSTGRSKPNIKTWNTFVKSTDINADYMLTHADSLVWQLATVPGQHMWGMETSILLPLMKRVCVCDARPLFPADIARLLKRLGEPKMLVTTPVHLRAMTKSGVSFPSLNNVLCATAPLDADLAEKTEQLFSAPLREIYGCSEVGSMAHRRTAQGAIWHVFRDISISVTDGLGLACASHLPESIVLSDQLKEIEASQFLLLGRSDDMVEIGGKRGSLAELNHILLASAFVVDGVVIKLCEDKTVNRLTAIVVLEAGATKADVIEQFRRKLDPVFIPRPIYVVDTLPRETNGKLPRKNIDALLAALKSQA